MEGAIFLDEEVLCAFEHAVSENLSLTDTAAMPDLRFDFVPLAVDTLGVRPSG